MHKRVVARIHATAGSLAFLIILSFFVSSALVEAWGGPAAIAETKRAIAWALLLLVPALAVTGGSGFYLTRGATAGLAGAKLRRMRVIAANGLIVLVPAALYLSWKAGAGAFDGRFALVQALEFTAGGVNLVLMGLNIRDGLRLSGRRRPSPSGLAG